MSKADIWFAILLITVVMGVFGSLGFDSYQRRMTEREIQLDKHAKMLEAVKIIAEEAMTNPPFKYSIGQRVRIVPAKFYQTGVVRGQQFFRQELDSGEIRERVSYDLRINNFGTTGTQIPESDLTPAGEDKGA